jgi:integrase
MTYENRPVVLRRRGKIKVREYRNRQRPHLKYYISFREAGRTRRQFFETKEQAKSEADFRNAELKQNGREHAEFPTWLRVMAQEAVERLQPFRKTIRDAVQHYVAHLKATEKSCSAEQLVKELLKAKEADGVGERQLYNLKSRLGYFAEQFDGKMVAEISTREIDDWLRSLGVAAQTRNHYRAAALSAFNFAVRSGYASTNPVEGAVKAKVIGGRPGILSVEQSSALLVNAPKALVPYFAIGLFAGLRRTEIERLDWSEIDFESGLIEVTAAKAKTAMRRLVTLQPNLREWLQPYRKLKGNVTPQENFRELFDQARTDAGIVDDEGIIEWPDNALRHSFASYHLAHFKNAASTALELGHHNASVTFAHYRELVRPKEAARYWNLKPVKRSRKIVQMA